MTAHRSEWWEPQDGPSALVVNQAARCADDGCALPFLADGQDAAFTGGYAAETWDGTGHFPHLEQPDLTATPVIRWLEENTELRQAQ